MKTQEINVVYDVLLHMLLVKLILLFYIQTLYIKHDGKIFLQKLYYFAFPEERRKERSCFTDNSIL